MTGRAMALLLGGVLLGFGIGRIPTDAAAALVAGTNDCGEAGSASVPSSARAQTGIAQPQARSLEGEPRVLEDDAGTAEPTESATPPEQATVRRGFAGLQRRIAAQTAAFANAPLQIQASGGSSYARGLIDGLASLDPGLVSAEVSRLLCEQTQQRGLVLSLATLLRGRPDLAEEQGLACVLEDATEDAALRAALHAWRKAGMPQEAPQWQYWEQEAQDSATHIALSRPEPPRVAGMLPDLGSFPGAPATVHPSRASRARL